MFVCIIYFGVTLEGNIYNYVLKTSDEDKTKIDLTVEKSFYSCNISFNVVENYIFHNLMHILKPSYKLPSHKELAGSLLDSVQTEIEESVKENLKGREGTIIIDEWSNEPITCIQVNGKSYNVDVENTGANKETAEF